MKFKHLIVLGAIGIGSIAVVKAATANSTTTVQWQAGDNSAAIQKAIDSGSSTVIIPSVDKPWLVANRIEARQPNQTIVFEPGVLMLAAKGGHKEKSASMMMINADNVTLSGYDATFQMRKEDYSTSAYQQSDFRHTVLIRGSENFVVEGLNLVDAGGDGIFISHGKRGGKEIPDRTFSSGVVRDVVVENPFRLGLSVMSARDLTVENSVFEGATGTKPASGIDIEPDYEWQSLINLNFINNQFLNNDRNGIQIGLGKYYGNGISPVSINFDGCEVHDNKEAGIKINANKAGVYNGATGLISFNNCGVYNSGQKGIHIKTDHTDPNYAIGFAFEDTLVSNTGNQGEESYPVTMFNTHEPGGVANIDFGQNFLIEDSYDRPGVYASSFSQKHGLNNVHGLVRVDNPKQEKSYLGRNLSNVTLKVTN